MPRVQSTNLRSVLVVYIESICPMSSEESPSRRRIDVTLEKIMKSLQSGNEGKFPIPVGRKEKVLAKSSSQFRSTCLIGP